MGDEEAIRQRAANGDNKIGNFVATANTNGAGGGGGEKGETAREERDEEEDRVARRVPD